MCGSTVVGYIFVGPRLSVNTSGYVCVWGGGSWGCGGLGVGVGVWGVGVFYLVCLLVNLFCIL